MTRFYIIKEHKQSVVDKRSKVRIKGVHSYEEGVCKTYDGRRKICG